MSIPIEFKWEFVFAVVVIICATLALIYSDFGADNWIYVLSLILAFLGGAGYGYLKIRWIK